MAKRATLQLPGRPLAVKVASDAAARAAQADGPQTPQPDANSPLDPDLPDPQAELNLARQALGDGLAKLDTLRAQLVRQAEQQLLELALDIARKVLMQEIQAGRYEIDPIVKEALRHVPPRQTAVAHLHPDDWARCQMAQEPSADDAGRIRFVADPSVPRAECVLETSEGIVQAAVNDHLDGIGEALGGAE